MCSIVPLPGHLKDIIAREMQSVKRYIFRGDDLTKKTREELWEIIVYLDHVYRKLQRELVQEMNHNSRMQRDVYG